VGLCHRWRTVCIASLCVVVVEVLPRAQNCRQASERRLGQQAVSALQLQESLYGSAVAYLEVGGIGPENVNVALIKRYADSDRSLSLKAHCGEDSFALVCHHGCDRSKRVVML
jgi:hypothetical protein